MPKLYYSYIMASQRNGTLYVGVTSDLARRVGEHKDGIYDGFTRKYNVRTLVWYEAFDYVHAAIQREKNIKKWPRKWKLNLIEATNPDWKDLCDEVY